MPAPRKTSDRYHSMAHYFGALIRDLRDSYESRTGDPLPVALLASRAGYSASMIGQLERGECLPDSGSRVEALDDALKARGQLKILWPVVQRLGHCPLDELSSAATNRAIPSYRETATCGPTQGDDMERRNLFKLAGWGLLAQSPIFSDSEHIRQQLERAIGTPEGLAEDNWEALCADYVEAVLTQPAAATRDELVVDLALLHKQMSLADPGKAAHLQRIAAWMSQMHANLLTRLGEYGEARRWWLMARQAADSSKDPDMRVWVRGTEAVFGLYSPRSIETVLTLSRDAQALAAGRVSPGLYQAIGAEAQALALLGRHKEAREASRRMHDLLDHLPSVTVLPWSSDSAWFVASWVNSFCGDTEAAREARDTTLARSPCFQNAANVRLHEGISLARSGGHNEALRVATEVITGLDPGYRTRMILHTAGMVLNTIPQGERANLSALADYREALRSSSRT